MWKLSSRSGIVDEPLPADRRARLLEVAAHHDDQVRRRSARPARCSRSAYSSAAFVSWIEHGPTTTTSRGSRPSSALRDRRARVGDDVRRALADRDLLEQDGGRNERPDLRDPEVVCAAESHPDRLLQSRFPLECADVRRAAQVRLRARDGTASQEGRGIRRRAAAGDRRAEGCDRRDPQFLPGQARRAGSASPRQDANPVRSRGAAGAGAGYRRDRERLSSERDSKIEKARRA